jgi:hypothetical protein
MKAAIVLGAGQTPIYRDFADPVPSSSENRITVSAAAISPVVKSRASGTHYSSSGQFPFVVGIDGVGRLDDGRRVYFFLPKTPHGSMAEQTVVPSAQCSLLPDGLDDVTAAAIANPGMSSWAAYKERAKLKAGETVLVNGATGTAGRLAVQIAKHLGAKKVHCDRAQCRRPAFGRSPWCRCDNSARRERGSARGQLQGTVRRRGECRRRLSVGNTRPPFRFERAWPKDDSTRRTVFTVDLQKSSAA